MKFTEVRLEHAITELLGVAGYEHVIIKSYDRAIQD